MIWRVPISAVAIAALFGCGPSYSPDTYATNAAQQANKVDPGVVVGVRKVGITAAGTVGTATGAAAGGIAGSQLGGGPVNPFTVLGGSLVGGIAGSTLEHATADTAAFEYIIRKPNGDLVSVTQRDRTPLALGQKVLVIAGNQARVVPDYTVSLPPTPATTTDPLKPNTASSDVKPVTSPDREVIPTGSRATSIPSADPDPTRIGPPEAAASPDVQAAPLKAPDAKPPAALSTPATATPVLP